MVSNPTVPRTTPSGFARHARAAASDLYLPREHWSPRGTWNPDRVVAALKDWTSLTGLPPRSYEWSPGTARALGLTSAGVRLWERQYPRWPSSKTVCAYFGRWSQALRAAGLTPQRHVAPGAERAQRVDAARQMARQGLATKDIAEILQISPRTVRGYLRAGSCADCGTPVITATLCPRCASRHAAQPRATRAQVLAAIRVWTADTGMPPRLEEWAPSDDPNRKWAREYPRWPSYMTVRTHFGSWPAALRAAGYRPNTISWDRESISRALRGFATETGAPPKQSDLDPPSLPSPGTVRHHFGSFPAALEACGFRPRRRRWQRSEILDAVAIFHRRAGRLPTERDWTSSTPEHPHASTVRQQFGSWSQLMTAYRSRVCD
jgi:hypothetical protein